MLTAAILLCRGVFTKFSQVFSLLEVAFISEVTFYHIQDTILLPAIMAACMAAGKHVYEKLKGQKLILSGDYCYDSPGYSAKCGTDTFMDTTTKLIVDFKLLQCAESTSSVGMNRQGYNVHSPVSVPASKLPL